jgi:hypothetical protein
LRGFGRKKLERKGLRLGAEEITNFHRILSRAWDYFSCSTL